jgi:putative drug exporter of the RND superfamily
MSQGRFSTGSLARASARRPWRVVGVWVVALIVAVVIVLTLFGKAFVSTNSFTGNPESKKGLTLLEQKLTGPQKPTELIVAQSSKYTVDQPQFKRYVTGLATKVAALGKGVVQGGASYYLSGDKSLVSKDRHSTLIVLVMSGTLNDAQKNVSKLQAAVAQADQAGFKTLVTGTPSIQADFSSTAGKDLRTGESIGAPIALLVLLVVFGAAVAAALPLSLALVAITLAVALSVLVGQAYNLSVFAINMISMMGLAVGIDYSLFVVSRFREERRKGLEKIEAIGVAGDTATRAVFFSGMTVVFALLGVLIVPTSIFLSLAVGAIAVVLMAVLAALTLLPAVLSLLGDRVNSLRLPFVRRNAAGALGGQGGRFWERFAHGVMRHPRVYLAAGVLVLVAASIPILSLRTGASGVGTLPNNLKSKQGFAVLQRDFIAGDLAPVQVVVSGNAKSAAVQASVRKLTAEIGAQPIFGPVQVQTDPAGDLTLVQTPLRTDPASDAAYTAIKQLRSSLVPAAFAGTPAQVYVSGQTALNLDYINYVNVYLPWVFALVLGLSFILLLVAFRSIVVPITAIFMNLLSVGAAYGLLVLFFQDGVGARVFGFAKTAQIEAWVPLLLFSVLFGLSMDYQVFLLSRIRERYERSGDTREAVAGGIGSTAGIITGAALIMVAVFGGFASGSLSAFQQIGFGLAVAVLIDATLIRIVLVPSAMALLGHRNWYLPRWLAWLPRLGVEGAALPGPAEGWAAGPADATAAASVTELARADGGPLSSRSEPESDRPAA